MTTRLRRVLPPVLAFAAPFVVYLRTLAPSVTAMDSGELAAVATTLGIAHPTGYPLFTLLAHAWTWLPLPGEPIRRLNMFAALCVALSAVAFYFLARQVLAWFAARASAAAAPSDAGPSATLCALAGAWTYAFARTVWDQATSVEVYSLHLVLAATALWLLVRAALGESPRARDWMAFGFVLGLGFANHMTIVTLAPAVLFLLVRRLGFGRRLVVVVALAGVPFALALTLYLYLPLRSAAVFPFRALGPPDLDWGGVGRGWGKFVGHVLGRQYSVWMFSGAWGPQLRRFLTILPHELAGLGLALAPVGLWAAFRRDRALGVFLLLLLLAPAAWAINYDIPDIDPYFLVSVAAAILLAAVGVYSLLGAAPRLAPLAFVLPVVALGLNWRHADRSRDFAVHDFAVNMLTHLEPGAVVVSTEGTHFDLPFLYLQHVGRLRPDVTVISLPLLRRTWYPEQLRRQRPELLVPAEAQLHAFAEDLERFSSGRPFDPDRLQARYLAAVNALIDGACGTRAVYLTPGVVRTEPAIGGSYAKAPAGFALRLVRKGDPPPPLVDRFDLARILASPLDAADRDDRWLLDTVAAGVERTRRYAAALGQDEEARRLSLLGAEVATKLR